MRRALDVVALVAMMAAAAWLADSFVTAAVDEVPIYLSSGIRG